jgi:hypothetical protein
MRTNPSSEPVAQKQSDTVSALSCSAGAISCWHLLNYMSKARIQRMTRSLIIIWTRLYTIYIDIHF